MLDDARKMPRILLTQNRDDFKKLHRQGLPHRGIVVCTYDPDTEALARRIAEGVSHEQAGERWLVSVVRPNPSQRKPKKRR